MKYTYLLINFFTVLIPFLFSFHPKLKFNRHFKAYFMANIVSASCFIIWDIAFTSLGVWGFNPSYIIGIYIFHLPIEEVLFFFCIPFACIFTYHCLNLFFYIVWKPSFENIFILIFTCTLLLIGVCYLDRLYTAVTFISTAFLILIFKFVLKIKWLPKIFIIYLVLLLPFFIVNGILTGTGIDEAVVWYNNTENLSIRLFTIPVEDVIYGFELIVLTIFFYQIFDKSFSENKIQSISD